MYTQVVSGYHYYPPQYGVRYWKWVSLQHL